MDLELKEIELAAKRLEPTIHRTKIESSKTFSDMTGGEIYLKFENQQKTGSFKIRGASNKIAALVERGEMFTTFPQLSLCRSLPLSLR